MRLPFKIRLALASLALVALALYCLWLWQPERQVLKHQAHFLAAAESRSWTKFASFIDPQFTDRWGHDKIFVVREASEWLRQFFSLTIKSEITDLRMESSRGIVSARLRLEGNGTPLAQMATDEFDEIHEPFVFEWTWKSWKPWDWKLTRADNADARFGARMNSSF